MTVIENTAENNLTLSSIVLGGLAMILNWLTMPTTCAKYLIPCSSKGTNNTLSPLLTQLAAICRTKLDFPTAGKAYTVVSSPGRTVADDRAQGLALVVLLDTANTPADLVPTCSGVPVRPDKLQKVHTPLDGATTTAGTWARNIHALRLLQRVESAIVR